MVWDCCFPLYPNTSIHLCVRAMTFYMLMIDVNSLVTDFDTNRLLTLLGHYVCFFQQKKKKEEERKKEKKRLRCLTLSLSQTPFSRDLPVYITHCRPATLLRKRLWHRCFPVNFKKFLRTPFLQNTSGG